MTKTRGFELITEYKGHEYLLPVRGTTGSAGYDFKSAESVVLEPGKVQIVSTGIKSYMGDDEYLQLQMRSSFASKNQVIIPQSVGIIDSDYYNNESNEGHIMVALLNLSDKDVEINAGERIAQGIFLNYLTVDNDMPTSNVRNGGFGSTGVK